MPSKASLQILENIYFKVEEGFLYLSCTDLEIGIKVRVVVKAEKGGFITVPGKQIADFVSAVDAEKISFELNDDSLKATTSDSEAVFVGIDAKEYPELPVVNLEPTLTFSPKALAEAVSYISFASSVDINRPVLSGVLLKVENGVSSFVATDGYRLSVKDLSINSDKPILVIVPNRFLIEAARLFNTGDETFLYYDSERSLVVFKNQEVELSSRLIEGNFPNYQAIIPTGFVNRTVFNKEDMARGLKLISVFAKDTGNIVKMKFTPGQGIELLSNSSQTGSSQSRISASVEGEELEVAFNLRYLNDFLNSTKTSQLILELSGKIKPALFQEMGNSEYKHIIMPVKLQN